MVGLCPGESRSSLQRFPPAASYPRRLCPRVGHASGRDFGHFVHHGGLLGHLYGCFLPGANIDNTGQNCRYSSVVPSETDLTGQIGTLVANGSVITTGLMQFYGTNNTGIPLNITSGTGSYTCSGNSSVTCGGTAQAGGVVEIVYTYSTITTPEPMTAGLAGGALLGLGLLARRKRARKA